MSTLGRRLREARKALGLTQEALGHPDFTKGFISLLENDRAKPSVASLERIAARLGHPVSYFLGDEDIAGSARTLGTLDSRGRAELAAHNYESALDTFVEMRRLAAAGRDAATELRAALGEGEALLGLARLDDARARLDEAVTRAQRLGEAAVECRACYGLAGIEAQHAHFDRAVSLYRSALEIIRRLEGVEPSFAGALHSDLGAALARLGHLDEAAYAYREATRLLEASTQPRRAGEALYERGAARLRDRAHEAARLHFERAQTLFAQHDDLHRLADVHDQAGALLAQAGRGTEAARHFEASLAARQRAQDAAGECRTLAEFARCAHACGEPARARELAERAVARSRTAGLGDEEARAQIVLGAIAAAGGDLKEAQQALSAAATHCEGAGMPVELVAIYRELARVSELAGRHREATGYQERAFRLLQSLERPDIAAALRSAPRSAAAESPPS